MKRLMLVAAMLLLMSGCSWFKAKARDEPLLPPPPDKKALEVPLAEVKATVAEAVPKIIAKQDAGVKIVKAVASQSNVPVAYAAQLTTALTYFMAVREDMLALPPAVAAKVDAVATANVALQAQYDAREKAWQAKADADAKTINNYETDPKFTGKNARAEKAEDEAAKAKDAAEASALLWMMLVGGGLLVAGAVCAYLFKSATIAIVGVIAGGGLILVSRLLSAVDHFITDNPVLAGLVAVGLILAVIGIIGWKGGWFFKKVADQTIAGTNDLLPGKADPAKQDEMTTILKAAQDAAVQQYIKAKVAVLDKADAIKTAPKGV